MLHAHLMGLQLLCPLCLGLLPKQAHTVSHLLQVRQAASQEVAVLLQQPSMALHHTRDNHLLCYKDQPDNPVLVRLPAKKLLSCSSKPRWLCSTQISQ